MVGRAAQAGSNFGSSERGAVLIVFALIVVPLLILIAIAIDFSQFLVMKRQLSAAADAAALDVATAGGLPKGEAMARAKAMIDANYTRRAIGALTFYDVHQSEDQSRVTVTAGARLDTTFLRLAGFDALDATVSAEAVRQDKLELALVLDNSGSMDGRLNSSATKMDVLKRSAKDLIGMLFGEDGASPYVKIAVVPFANAVNVGPDGPHDFIDVDGRSRLNGENLELGAIPSLYRLFERLPAGGRRISWQGCVRQRAEPYDVRDDPPAPETPETLFVPYFAPDEPDYDAKDPALTMSYANTYLSDAAAPGTSPQQRQASVRKYLTVEPTDWWNKPNGPNAHCPAQKVVPLSNTPQEAVEAIDNMKAGGSTVIPAGLAWGWYVISPNSPFAAKGTPYGEASTVKAIVLLTDGENSVNGGRNGMNKSIFSAYGYAAAGHHLGQNLARGGPERELDRKLEDLCANIKASGVLIFTVALGAGNTAERLLETCASDRDKFFTAASADQLPQVFHSIAASLNRLRLAR